MMSFQTCNLRTCEDYRIPLKNKLLMFRHVILVINDGATVASSAVIFNRL